MRYLVSILLFVCFSGLRAEAQNFEGEANEIADTIFESRGRDSAFASTIPENYWQGIYDSVLYVVLRNYLYKNIDKEKYSWPTRFFHQQFRADMKEYPDDNYKFLLKIKYHIDMDEVSTGCMWQEAFVLYDSLMSLAIVDKYGSDFFEQSKREADSLKLQGTGLNLPYITTVEKTTQILVRNFCFLDKNAQKLFGSRDPKALVIKFHGDTVNEVTWSKKMEFLAGIWTI